MLLPRLSPSRELRRATAVVLAVAAFGAIADGAAWISCNGCRKSHQSRFRL